MTKKPATRIQILVLICSKSCKIEHHQNADSSPEKGGGALAEISTNARADPWEKGREEGSSYGNVRQICLDLHAKRPEASADNFDERSLGSFPFAGRA